MKLGAKWRYAPAPRNDAVVDASAFCPARAPRCAIRSGSESAGGRSRSRWSRTAAGTGSNSASTLGTPMASSIRRASSVVLGM
jgi:hypothetical protein